MSRHHGLRWKSTIWGTEPEWTVEPQLEAISGVVQQYLGPGIPFELGFLTQGAFNKIYTVKHGNGSLIMRVSLPVDPMWKTLSEVATVNFVALHSDLPVPTVHCFSSTTSNPIGFEWTILNRMPGTPVEGQWRAMHWSAKEALVKQMAVYAVSMFRKKFWKIGNLLPDEKKVISADSIQHLQNTTQYDGKQRDASQLCYNQTPGLLRQNTEDAASADVDRLVSMEFFWDNRLFQNVPRGPFSSSHDWLSARLLLNENEKTRILLESDDVDDREEAEKTLQIILRLKELLPTWFPAKETGERSMIFHDDISFHNLLVDKKGVLTAVLDWECVSVVPLWKACDFPAFLEDKPRRERPNEDSYKKDEAGKVNNLYWTHLLEYELTQLRSLYLEKMQGLEPDWFEVYISSHMQRDFDIAVRHCDSPHCMRAICEWLDALEKGVECNLHSQLMK